MQINANPCLSQTAGMHEKGVCLL